MAMLARLLRIENRLCVMIAWPARADSRWLVAAKKQERYNSFLRERDS
jgi:hypothetical protein